MCVYIYINTCVYMRIYIYTHTHIKTYMNTAYVLETMKKYKETTTKMRCHPKPSNKLYAY